MKWKEKVFFLCPEGTLEFDRLLNYAILGFCTMWMHIMSGTCVSNLRSKRWMEHTQMRLALMKGTKNFHYTSNSWGIISEFNFLFKKNSNGEYEGFGVI